MKRPQLTGTSAILNAFEAGFTQTLSCQRAIFQQRNAEVLTIIVVRPTRVLQTN